MSTFSGPRVIGDENEGLRDSNGFISKSPECTKVDQETRQKIPPQQMPAGRKILLHLKLEATAKSEENKDKEEGETSTRHPGPVFEALAGLAETGRHSASLLLDLSPWQKEVVVGLTGDCPSHHERCDLG